MGETIVGQRSTDNGTTMSTEFKKVSLHSVPALKTESDEHLSTIFDGLGYTESFTIIDVKLVVGYLSVAAAGLMYYLDKQYKNDFNNKTYVLYIQLLVVAFFTLQFIWYLVSKFVEKDVKYTGKKQGKTIKVSTSTKSKTDPFYQVIVNIDGKDHSLSIPFKDIFFDDGFLSLDAFKGKIVPFIESVDKSK